MSCTISSSGCQSRSTSTTSVEVCKVGSSASSSASRSCVSAPHAGGEKSHSMTRFPHLPHRRRSTTVSVGICSARSTRCPMICGPSSSCGKPNGIPSRDRRAARYHAGGIASALISGGQTRENSVARSHMSWSFSHPNTDTLVGFASRTLATPDERRVAQHLEACTECRDTVVVLRAVDVVERDAQPRDELFERILLSRAAGLRTILPTDDATVMTRRRPVARLAGLAIAAALLAVILFRGSREGSAGERTGYLRLDPARALPGAPVRATYTPSAFLQGFDSLVLRARFRRPNDDDYNIGPMQQRAAVLHRTTGGVFSGEFRLPDSVVFAVFAVESPSGDRVDDNDERLWELLTADEAHRPLFESLVQKERDLMGRNWTQGLKTERSLAALYPQEPEAWSLVPVYERWVLGDHIADSLLPGHRRRFAAFHAGLAEQRSLPVRTVLGMLHYAVQIDVDTATSRYWLHRLEREFPDDPDVLFRRENRLWHDYAEERKDTGSYFREVESVWARAERNRDPELSMMVYNALVRTIVAKDTAAMRVWVPRYRRVQRRVPEMASYWGKSLLRYPTLRRDGMEWLREEARLLAEGPDAFRPLTATTAEQRVANGAASQPIL